MAPRGDLPGSLSEGLSQDSHLGSPSTTPPADGPEGRREGMSRPCARQNSACASVEAHLHERRERQSQTIAFFLCLGKGSLSLALKREQARGLQPLGQHTHGQGGSQKLPTPSWRPRVCGDPWEYRPGMARARETPSVAVTAPPVMAKTFSRERKSGWPSMAGSP